MLNPQKIGIIFIWMGVAAWLPFLYLLAVGQHPSIYPFLAVHLVGILGGSRMKALAKKDKTPRKRHKRQVIGRIMIILGVLAWLPYLYQKELLDMTVEIRPYLSVHLFGVLGGIALLVSVPLIRLLLKDRYSIEGMTD
jgi:hypothetical protein